jgi:DNA excision repair protein ERCC-6
MELAGCSETNAEIFDQEILASTIVNSKQEALAALEKRLQACISDAHAGNPVNHALVLKLRTQIAALTHTNPAPTVDLPTSIPAVNPPAAEPDSLTESVHILDDLSIKSDLWNRLFDHQRQAVQWLAGLIMKGNGGILADEMGLGKTIEVSALLEALSYSGKIYGPVLVLCPATIVSHWRSTLQGWAPSFPVSVFEDEKKQAVIKQIKKKAGVLVTNYELLYSQEDLVAGLHWQLVILDEGHKIRNPISKVTLACKRLKTTGRLLLSGTPIQNNLTEFWSLVDFVNPGLLGSLEAFDKELAAPILRAGYASSDLRTAELGYQCACQLRDLISPYILRRTKKELKVSLGLPEKEEKLLLCDMTETQYETYVRYLDKYTQQLENKKDVFKCIRDLRHISNHPCILTNWKKREMGEIAEHFSASGKLQVLGQLLTAWAEASHKTAIFSQSKKMLSLCEALVASLSLPYARIDGDTMISERLPVIEAFNSTNEYTVLLLTTKVGGLGLNLTGASRVVILDPDWNPMTDIQAKERAMRIGQHKDVTVYRFLTKSSIEEKVYRRQVFKVFLANRILHSPEQKKFFANRDLKELFEYPRAPKRTAEPQEEEELVKRRKLEENAVLASLFDADGVKREDLAQSVISDPANTVEMRRLETHAKALAQKATEILLRSRAMLNFSRLPVPTISYQTAPIRFGTSEAASIIAKVRQSACSPACESPTAPVTTEELAAKRLYELLKERGSVSSTEIVAFGQTKLRGFEARLVKAVLKALATVRNGQWRLREQFLG